MPASSSTGPSWDSIIKEIERVGFHDHTLVAEYDLHLLDEEHRVQVREDQHYAPKHMVDRFAVQMNESVFPPIVVTEDNYLVDGSTRVGARKQREDRFAPAFVIAVRYGDPRTSEEKKLLLKVLAATLNSNGGKQLEKKESMAAVRHMIALEYKNDEIARTLGVSPNMVTRAKAERTAETKLDHVGLGESFYKDMRPTSKRALGRGAAVDLNDLPFKALAELSVDAGLNATEVAAVAKKVKDTGSDTAAMDALTELRAENATRIAEVARTGSGRPSVAGQLRQHLGFVVKHSERDMIETSPDVTKVVEHQELIRRSIDMLQRVLTEQEAEVH
jgi:hypothetical protein